MSGNTATLRQLTIKTNVVKRLAKEVHSDIKESQDRQVDLDRIRDSGADGADIRNAERVLKDAEMMVPRTKVKLERAVEELEDLVDALGADKEIIDSAEWQAAYDQVRQVKAASQDA